MANLSEAEYKQLPLAERLALALSEDLPDAYRHFMLREQWMQIKCYFARRQDLRPDEVSVLLADPDHVIRLCIAKRDDLTPEQVAACVADPDANVRYFIARSPQLTEGHRAQLAEDPDPLVRRAIAKGAKPTRTRRRAGQAALIR